MNVNIRLLWKTMVSLDFSLVQWISPRFWVQLALQIGYLKLYFCGDAKTRPAFFGEVQKVQEIWGI